MIILICILCIICSFCAGLFIGRGMSHFDGLFIVDESDKNSTRWILDMRQDPMKIPSKKEIRLKVQKMTEGDV